MTGYPAIRKAVIPAAGKGTRMLPLTENIPKELLPVAGKPVIQYVIEEAIESGINEIVLVVHPEKEALQRFIETFDWNKKIKKFHFIQQLHRQGLGDAILRAKPYIAKSPFAVLLGDNIVETAGAPLTGQLSKLFSSLGASIVALEEVPDNLVNRYGIVSPERSEIKDVYKLTDVIEKPPIHNAPSNLAFASRYIFTPEIFSNLELTDPGYNNEIQLTDAMRLLLKSQDIYGYRFNGKRHDIGNPEDYKKVCEIFERDLNPGKPF